MSEIDHLIYKKIYPDSGAIFNLNVEPIEKVKGNCIYVLDTNVLLTPYTTSKTSLKGITAIYKKLIDQQRLFIPGHVAREFAMNRPEKIKEIFSTLTKKQSNQRSFFIDEYPLLEDNNMYKKIISKQKELDQLFNEHRKLLSSLAKTIKNWNWNDPVSEVYRDLFTTKVIYDPDLDEKIIKEEYEKRQKHKTPPGYRDYSKPINADGDLLIWFTILKLAEEKKQNIIFVSSDEKSDWFHRAEKQPLIPRFELQYEYKSKIQNKSFYIIRLSDLLKLYSVSEKIIDEIKNSENIEIRDTQKKNILLAIKNKRCLEFYYNGGYRTAEPYCYGVSRKGNDLLRAFQTGGYSESSEPANWKLFAVEKMSNITITDEEFSGNRPEYKLNDPAMEDIYCNIFNYEIKEK